LDKVKTDLSTEISRFNNTKIVVVIDDLDRCEPEEILIMLNIVKNI
jgi:predicted KAP-like P-loop ATPase